MGKYSDDSDGDYGRRNKRKRRSRSRSRSNDSYSSSHSKHKKKKSKSSRRRSRSPKRRRSRSKSRDRSKRSRSRSRRRSRSRSRRRSRSYDRRRSRSRSYDRRRSRSRNRDRRSSSNSRFSPKDESSRSSFKIESDPSSVPGFEMMTPLEQNEVRMQLALKAADMAAERLKAAGVLEDGETSTSRSRPVSGLNAEEIEKRRKAIENIEADNFKQAQFKSSGAQSNSKPLSARKQLEASHESAMFGDLLAGTGMDGSVLKPHKTLDTKDARSLMGPVFREPEAVKMSRWIEKLKELRRHSHSNGAVS